LVLLVLVGIGAYLGYQAVRNSRADKAFVGAHDIKGLESVIHRYGGTTAAGNAYLEIAAAQAASGQYNESDNSYQAFVKEYSSHPLFVNGLFGLASNAEAEGKSDEALKYYSDIFSSSKYRLSYLAPLALYYHGRITESSSHPKEALQDFEEMLQDYPQSFMAASARRDADRLTAKLGLNVQAKPSPTVGAASASPQASTSPQGSPSPQASAGAQGSPSAQGSPTAQGSPSAQASATPRSTLEP
jgi:tetratricopeptide (TPR) repeat protein